MAHRKAGGTAKNLRDSNPKYLGVKLYTGEKATPGSIIIRQRGTAYRAGSNVKMGKDHTLFAVAHGVVAFTDRRRTAFNGRVRLVSIVSVKPH